VPLDTKEEIWRKISALGWGPEFAASSILANINNNVLLSRWYYGKFCEFIDNSDSRTPRGREIIKMNTDLLCALTSEQRSRLPIK
jgi:hypothetical protein